MFHHKEMLNAWEGWFVYPDWTYGTVRPMAWEPGCFWKRSEEWTDSWEKKLEQRLWDENQRTKNELGWNVGTGGGNHRAQGFDGTLQVWACASFGPSPDNEVSKCFVYLEDRYSDNVENINHRRQGWKEGDSEEMLQLYPL